MKNGKWNEANEVNEDRNTEIVQAIHEIIAECKLRGATAQECADVARSVFAVIAASSSKDPVVKIAAISGMIEIERIG